MASPDENATMEEPQQLQLVLGKRKRDDDNGKGDLDEADGGNDDTGGTLLTILDENDIVPEDCADVPDDDDPLHDLVPDADDEETDGEMDEDEASHVPYDVNSEPFPKCAVYDNDMRKIATDFLKIPQKIVDVLRQHDCDSVHVQNQREAAATLLIIPPAKKVRIALLGDAGAGKSSVLNSLSDIQDLAKSLSGGQSCTCVPTEYSGAFPRQNKNFAAKIIYSDVKSIRRLLGELLEDYNTYAFERDEDWDEETHTAFKRKMNNALKTFQTLLCDLPEFADQKTARATLQKAYEDGASKQLIKTMMESCEVKLKDKLSTKDLGYSDYREAMTRAKLREAVDPLMTSKTNFDQPALWPLVKQVCIGVRDSRVLKNITIIDLPGISDTNETRVNLTKEYIKTCDHIWIVANISRVIDDGMVDHLLSKYGKIYGGNVAVICTHSDDGVDTKLAKEMKDHRQDTSEYRQLGEQAKAKTMEVNKLKAQINEVKSMKKKRKFEHEKVERLVDQLQQTKAELQAREASKFGALVRVRNTFITEQLQAAMEYHLADGQDLNVFCVSNSHYAAARRWGPVRGARLDADSTGIPRLRKFALELPAPRLLRAIDDYSRINMAIFLHDLGLWVNKTTVERRNELMEMVRKPAQELPSHTAKHSDNFRLEIARVVSEPMRALQNAAIESALKVSALKGKKHGSTVRAFIKKNGLHSTKLCPKECWNEQFSKVTSDFIVQNWDFLSDYCAKFHEKLRDVLTADLRAVTQSLKEQSCASALPLERLEKFVNSHASRIKAAFRDEREVYERDLRVLYLDVTQHSDKNYFSQSIQPVYDECKSDSGKGVTKRSMDRLEAHLRQPAHRSPFMRVEKKATKAIVENDVKHVEHLRQVTAIIYGDTFASFDRLIARDVDDKSEKVVREHIKKELTELHEDYKKVSAKLEEVKGRCAA